MRKYGSLKLGLRTPNEGIKVTEWFLLFPINPQRMLHSNQVTFWSICFFMSFS